MGSCPVCKSILDNYKNRPIYYFIAKHKRYQIPLVVETNALKLHTLLVPELITWTSLNRECWTTNWERRIVIWTSCTRHVCVKSNTLVYSRHVFTFKISNNLIISLLLQLTRFQSNIILYLPWSSLFEVETLLWLPRRFSD